MEERKKTVGCVIMASGLGQRFGSNKLLADFRGKPMMQKILETTGEDLFVSRVAVTRHKEVELLCRQQGVDVILHEEPWRNDTVRLGTEWMMKYTDCAGCMFCQADQPLLTRKSLENMVQMFEAERDICRLSCGEKGGSPILFGKAYFEELRKLPRGKGGGYLLEKYEQNVKYVQAENAYEMWDVDTKEDMERLKKAVAGK